MSQTDRFLKQGLLSFEQGEYQQAIALLTSLIELESDRAIGYYLRGEALKGLEEYPAALKDLDRAIALEPEDADFYYSRSEIKASLKDYHGVISDCNLAITLGYPKSGVYFRRGYTYWILDNFAKAIADYTQALALDSELPHLYFLRGLAKQRLEDYQSALTDFNQAIDFDSADGEYFFERGYTHAKLNDLQKAIKDYTEAIRLEPEYLEAYVNRGNTYARLGEPESAIADYTKAIQLDPEIIAIYQNRGKAYAEMGQSDKAISDWQRGIDLLQHRNDLYANTITSVLSDSIAAESAKNQTPARNLSDSRIEEINKELDDLFNPTSTRKLNLIYRPKFADEQTIENPHLADLEGIVDELWQEAQYIIKENTSRFTGHFILKDNQTQDYIQGMWDTRFYPAGGFHLEWSCNGNRSWLPLPQTDSETKEVLRLWAEDIQACSALNWELIGDRDPMSLNHASRRGFKIIHLLKQYEAGERNFRKEDLSNANLFETDLQGINLSQACLVSADLRGANLTRANLTAADLSGACLIETDLRSANLTGANLTDALYDEDTEFPSGFDPEAAEMEFYGYEEDEAESTSDTASSHYLETADEISGFITHLAALEILWLDTEIADWQTKQPRLSLIQVLADPQDTTGESAYILDVLDCPEIAAEFIDRIMINPDIEKVFHNASFDLKYLGEKRAKNVTCTLKIARKIGKQALGTSNLKLKTLAVELCNFDPAEIENEQGSDWGKRPLSREQIKYAKMDVVYLAQLHHQLLEFKPDMPSSPSKSFSVTDVRVAVECPRLFYLSKHFGGKTLFIPKSGVVGIGNTFHKLADDFITTIKNEPQFKTLFELPAEQLEVNAIVSGMQDIFYSLVFFPNYLQPTIQTKPDLAPALNQVWQGIRSLIQKWTELLIKNRAHCNADLLFDSTFVSTEFKLQHNFKLPNGTKQAIAGRLDCLVYDYSKNSLCVVELKTYAPVDPSAQLAQVALYSYMIEQTKQVPVDSAVYCVLPEFKEYFYSWSELETNLHQVIPHKLQQMQQWLAWQPPQPDAPPATSNLELCNICPQAQKCQSFFPDERQIFIIPEDWDNCGDRPEPDITTQNNQDLVPETPQSQDKSIDPEPIGRELVDILKSFKVNVEYIGAIAGSSFIRIKLKPAKGVKVASILKLAEDLQVQLSIARPPLIATQAGYVSVDIPREDRQTAYFKDYIQPQNKPDGAPITIAMGVNLEGKLVEVELASPNNCHFLVGGVPGSGKSEFLRSLLLSLIYRHTPEQIKIALVDPKRVTFPEFEQMPWLLSPIVEDSDTAISLMEQLVAEMDKRYQLFKSAKCPHLDDYNQKSSAKLPRIVCIFDEYADLMSDKETRKALETSIKRLGGMARAAGIHLIIATQRPDANVVTPIIRDNLPGRIALSTSGSEANSKIILGGNSTEAAYLLGKGDLLLQVNAQLQRLQSLYASKIELP